MDALRKKVADAKDARQKGRQVGCYKMCICANVTGLYVCVCICMCVCVCACVRLRSAAAGALYCRGHSKGFPMAPAMGPSLILVESAPWVLVGIL